VEVDKTKSQAIADNSAPIREETKSTTQIQPQKQIVDGPKPSFESLIKLQSSRGFWGRDSHAVLALCIEGGVSEDAGVMQSLRELGIEGGDALEQIYLTLLALFILEEAYLDYEDEWQMIAKKGKTYLEQAGVSKPNNLIRKFTLQAKID